MFPGLYDPARPLTRPWQSPYTARFVSPAPAGSRIRGRFTLLALEAGPGGSTRARWNALVEREGAEKPACAAEWLLLYYE